MLRRLSGLPQELHHSPHSVEFGHWNSYRQCGVCRCGPNRLKRRALQTGAEDDEGAGTELARGGACSGGLDILTIKWATRDLPEECRFLLESQLMFLKQEKDRTTKRFDDDEWIRSLRKRKRSQRTSQKTAPRMTSKTLTPRKCGPSTWEISCGISFPGDSWHSVREKLQPDSRNQQTSSSVVQKSTPVPMIRSTRAEKQRPGTWTTVTSCATQSWCCLFCRTSTLPVPSELS